MKSQVTRLEQALMMWEEFMWCGSVMRRAADKMGVQILLEDALPAEGPYVHFRELRRHLLTIRNFDEFDTERFEVLLEAKAKYSRDHERSDHAPIELLAGRLAAWTTSSRRVYRIDADLQALLGATSLKSLTFNDIKFPFESFAIELEEPIYCPFSNRYFDFILYSPAQGRVGEDIRSRHAITFFNRDLDRWRPLSSRPIVERKLARGRVEEAAHELSAKRVGAKQNDMLAMHIIKGNPDVPILEILGWIGDMPEQEGVASRQVWQIVIGLAMYLKMLPPTSPHVGRWNLADPNQRMLGSLDKRAITDESEICSVTSVRKLSVEERKLFFDYASGRGDYELSAHFRIGYWHRPRGRGQDPNYPKTEWTHPTLVRRDRLPEGAIPGGSKVKIP